MARNLNDLARSMNAKAKQVEKAASEVAKTVAIRLISDLVYRTPVDTSTALSNWQVSIGAPVGTFIQAYSPGYQGYTQLASAETAISVGKKNLEAKKPGQIIYITNKTPYIRGLNSGTSKQAPAGFVEAAVLIARKKMPTVKL